EFAQVCLEIGLDRIELFEGDGDLGAEIVGDDATTYPPRVGRVRIVRRAAEADWSSELGIAGVNGGLRLGLCQIILASAHNNNFSTSLCCRTDTRRPE